MDRINSPEIYNILTDRQEARHSYESQAVQEMSDSILGLKSDVRDLLQRHLFDIKKLTSDLSDRLELTQNTLHHLLNLMIIDPSSAEYKKAQVDFMDAAKNFLEQRAFQR